MIGFSAEYLLRVWTATIEEKYLPGVTIPHEPYGTILVGQILENVLIGDVDRDRSKITQRLVDRLFQQQLFLLPSNGDHFIAHFFTTHHRHRKIEYVQQVQRHTAKEEMPA